MSFCYNFTWTERTQPLATSPQLTPCAHPCLHPSKHIDSRAYISGVSHSAAASRTKEANCPSLPPSLCIWSTSIIGRCSLAKEYWNGWLAGVRRGVMIDYSFISIQNLGWDEESRGVVSTFLQHMLAVNNVSLTLIAMRCGDHVDRWSGIEQRLPNAIKRLVVFRHLAKTSRSNRKKESLWGWTEKYGMDRQKCGNPLDCTL